MRTALTLTLASLLLLGSAANVSAEPECQAIDGLGEACYEIGQESGSITYDIENEDLGLDAEGEVSYGIGL